MDKKAGPKEKSALEKILEWSQSRPLWQRDALRIVVTQGRATDDDIARLVSLCKLGRFPLQDESIAPEPLAEQHFPARPNVVGSVSLLQVSGAEGVNNLAAGQTLAFGPAGITVVYGDNGAGKSGYARILKRACRARHTAKIEPNVYAPDKASIPGPSATLVYKVGSGDPTTEKWQDAKVPHAILSAISVFDSDCAAIHVNQKNEIAFKPLGLDIPDALVAVYQRVKAALVAEQRELIDARNAIFSSPTWKPTTTAGKALSALGPTTDLESLRVLATLTEEEQGRLRQLKTDLSKDPTQAAREQELRASNLERLSEIVADLGKQVSPIAVITTHRLARDAHTKRQAAQLAAEIAFSKEPLPGTGDAVWRTLWDSAQRFSTTIAYIEKEFPVLDDGAVCVLCQSQLSPEASKRLARFQDFVCQDAETQARAAEKSAHAPIDTISKLDLRIKALRPYFEELKLTRPELAKSVLRFMAGARLRRCVMLRTLGRDEELSKPIGAPAPFEEIARLAASTRTYATVLRASTDPLERQKLQIAYMELQDRDALNNLLPDVKAEISRLSMVAFFNECIGETSTNSVTSLGNELADEIVTPRLRDKFMQEIVKLADGKIRVEIVRSGGAYGSPEYQVKLVAKSGIKVQDVLSEGEKTCVALAVFLTELTTAGHQSTLIFDDPVSSLDHRWRQQVAKRLVEESEHRQIIVFTHDLVLANDLIDMAKLFTRPIEARTIFRGRIGAGIVTDGLPWKMKSVEDRIDAMEKAAREIKPAYDSDDEEQYGPAAENIYNDLRSTWERGLEAVAFFNVVTRHRDYINAKDLKKVTALTEADCDAFQAGYKRCCDITDAHDKSAGRNAPAPAYRDLIADIAALKTWVQELRSRQKQIATK